MQIKQKSPFLPRNLALVTSGELLIVFSINVNLLYLLYSTGWKCCLLHLIKQNCLLKTNLDDSGITLPVFPSRTNLKLHNISVTPKMVRKVVMNLDLSKASGPDCIPVVVLKNCEPELSYILAELFNKWLKECCFLDCWKVSSVVPVFKNVGERPTAKNYHLVSLLSVVSKFIEKLVNSRIVDHLGKFGFFFLISSMVLVILDQLQIFSQLYLIELLGLLTGLGLLELWHLIHPRLLTGFGMEVFFRNLSLMEFQISYMALFLLFLVIDGFESFWMETLQKNIQLMQEFLKALFLVLHFSYYTLIIFLMMLSVMLLSMLMILLFILSAIRHLICENDWNWLLNLNLIYETLDQGKKWLVDFNTGKTLLVSFDQFNDDGSIDGKMDGSVLEEKSSFKMLGLTFSSNLDWGSYIISITKTASMKIEALIRSMKFVSPEVALYLCKFTICPCMEYCCHV